MTNPSKSFLTIYVSCHGDVKSNHSVWTKIPHSGDPRLDIDIGPNVFAIWVCWAFCGLVAELTRTHYVVSVEFLFMYILVY